MAQIDKPNLHFNTVLTTGDGTSSQAVTTGFQPDLIWWKNRGAAQNHRVQNSITGTGNAVYTSLSQAADTGVTSYLQSFDSNGFTMGTDFASSNNFVSWAWKAGGTASSNTDGSITSSVSANTTAGVSIVSFTGTGANGTVGHGLGQTPAMIIQKNLSITSAWSVWHKSFNGNQVIYLNETGTVGSNTSSWNSTTPTASVFSVGTGSYPNGSGNSQIYYVFAEKKGFSKIGTYIGNGNADGTFVYTGFKPAFLLYKSADQNSNWLMWDSKRPGYNEIQKLVMPNLSNVEGDSGSDALDFLSNGFKFRGTGAATNGSGQAVIYMAFAENPIVGSNDVPATAR